MKTLYFDCFAGASGNMILAALIALGVDREELIEHLKTLDVVDFEIEFSTRDKSGISATHAFVRYAEEKKHRHLHNIVKIIEDSSLSDAVKRRSVEIFTRLAEAEAKVHGISVEKVHFHEVGAMDAIIDVVGACVGFEILGIERFLCSKIHVGSGFVEMEHGKFPVPPPAVAELLKDFPVYSTEIEGELITPTGAAIISTVCGESKGVLPEMRVEKTAYGAGTRDYKDFPNALRLILGETGNQLRITNYELRIEEQNAKDKGQRTKDKDLILLETNLDDISPEILGFVMERAFEIGALDCWFTPIQMKKNRPAAMLSVLCDEEKREGLLELIYSETSTLGVRISKVERNCLEREISQVETEFGEISVKIAKYNGKIVNAKPEYEHLREIAVKSKIPLREIEMKILKKLSENL